MMRSNSFRLPAEVISGRGCIQEIGDRAAALHLKRVLVVTDKGVSAAGLAEQVQRYLTTAGVEVHTFDEVIAEPPLDIVDTGARLAREFGCDGVVGLGGGSSMDCGKGIALVAPGVISIREYAAGRPIDNAGLATLMVPTTAGTGSEVTGIAVFRDEAEHLKVGIANPHLVATAALVDPMLALTAPPAVTASSGIDALVHAIEALTSNNSSPITDTLAAEAIRRIAVNLRRAVADGSDIEARCEMAIGSLLAGMALANAGVAAAHALEYPLGGRYHLPHGIATGILLPPVIEVCWEGDPLKYRRAALSMGLSVDELTQEEAIARTADAIKSLLKDIGAPSGLGEVGVSEDSIRPMVEAASKITRLLRNSPKKLSDEDLEWCYRRAM